MVFRTHGSHASEFLVMDCCLSAGAASRVLLAWLELFVEHLYAKCPFRSGSWDALSYCALKSMSQSNLVLNALPSVLILQLIQESVFTR